MASDIVQGSNVGAQVAPEVTLGTLATTGWRAVEPDDSRDYYPQIEKVERDPINALAMREKGAVVGLEASPSITADLTRDVAEYWGSSWYRAVPLHPGGTGIGRWATSDQPTPTLTAVTATGYTVSAGGAVPSGTLVWAEGFATAANNGLKVTASSVAGEVKAAGLTAEAAPPSTAVLYVVGYQGAAADIAVDADGNLTSAALVLASIGARPGAFAWLGGGTAATPGSLGFATAGNRGFFRIVTVEAGKLTVDRRSQSWVADVGAGKTIQIFLGPWWRNVARTHADYREPSHSIEVAYPGAGTADATAYAYAVGACVNEAVISAPSEDKITVQMSLMGTDLRAPTDTRATGAASPIPVLAGGAFTTADQIRRLRIADGVDETGISTDISTWTLTIGNNTKPQVQQGVLGARRMIFGDFTAMLEASAIFVDIAACAAIRNNTTSAFDVAMRSTDATIVFDIPSMDPTDGNVEIAQNEAVTLALGGSGHRDRRFNFVGGMTLFAYLPID